MKNTIFITDISGLGRDKRRPRDRWRTNIPRKVLGRETGQKVMRVFQSSKRTGYMTVELQGDKVRIFGKAVIVLEGELVY